MPHSLQKKPNWRPGVSLRPDVSGGRIWVQNIKIDNKPRIVELGRFPEIGLPEARARAEQNSQKVASGVNILSTLRRSHEQYLKQQIAELNTRLKSDDPAPDADTAIDVSTPAEEPPATAPTSHPALVRRAPKTDSPPPAVAATSAVQDTPAPTPPRHKVKAPTLPHENIRGRDYFS
ncbi:Arm DNA-binding domain-containing protein [Thalassobacter stenotrophicus]|nr:Arm DNA-binding domain-containing protein [Thalassobacter stenotrophicus]PVZ48575.1 DUF4102 domain-containing protein [Thalassobacter stenotrophicus]